MDKEALLNIILSDLNEIGTLIKSFQGKQDIPEAFINLTERKLSHIAEEFTLLKTLPSQGISSKETIEQPSIQRDARLEPETQKKADEEQDEKELTTIIEDKSTPVTAAEIQIKESATPIESLEKQDVKKEERSETLASVTSKDEQVKATNKRKEEERITEEQSKTIGETLGADKKSVHDLMSATREPKVQNKLIGKPINNLIKGLGINDRFLFQRELFGGDGKLMQHTLEQINTLSSLEEAYSFISANFSWDAEGKVTQSFYNYIKRKFI
jgi:hypothetical protein